MSNSLKLLALACATFAATGCDFSGGGGSSEPTFPTLEKTEVKLVTRPSNDQLASWFCLSYADKVPLIGSTVKSLCKSQFGDKPADADMTFTFETVFTIANSNNFPIPLVELLLNLNVFPGEADEKELANMCVSFCDPDAGECAAKDPKEQCLPPEDGEDPFDWRNSIVDLVKVGASVLAGESLSDALNIKMLDGWGSKCYGDAAECVVSDDKITCGNKVINICEDCEVSDSNGQICMEGPGHTEAHVAFNIDINTVTNILLHIAEPMLEEAVSTMSLPNEITFVVPYALKGAIFLDIPVLGRYSFDFGPFNGEW